MEHGVPQRLITPKGDLLFNAAGGPFWLTNVSGAGSIRSTVESRPQRDGGIVHRSFRAGATPVLDGWIEASTLALRTQYMDEMRTKTQSILRSNGRWLWTPSNAVDRMLLNVRLVQPVTIVGGVHKDFQIGLTSEHAYAIGAAETLTTIASGSTVTITNLGNAPSYPNIRVKGPITGFTLSNDWAGRDPVFENVKSIVMAGITGIAAGDYIEILPFTETAYANGTGANQLGKITHASTDFWTMEPGANVISFTGVTGGGAETEVEVRWNHGWVI